MSDSQKTLTVNLLDMWTSLIQVEGDSPTQTFRVEETDLGNKINVAEETYFVEDSKVNEESYVEPEEEDFTDYFAVDDDDDETEFCDGYTYLDVVGKGGMGTVHEIEQHCLRRSVAVKIPNSINLHKRFLEEALVTGYLNHPNIIFVHDLLERSDNSLGMVMPLIEGTSWKSKLKEEYRNSGKLSSKQLRVHIENLIKVCEAVSYAHHRGVLHNDLKLENIMVGDFGDVVLMDWGCATQNPKTEIELPFHILHPEKIRRPFGSPCYMPPELANGNGMGIGPHTDTYLLGTMLYEIIEGREPREGNDIYNIIQRASIGEYDQFRVSSSSLLRQVCTRALSVKTSERYQNPVDFGAALRDYFRAESGTMAGRRAVGQRRGNKFSKLVALGKEQSAG